MYSISIWHLKLVLRVAFIALIPQAQPWLKSGRGPYMGWMSIPFFSPPSLPRLPLSLHPSFTHSLPYFSFFLFLSLAVRSGLLPTFSREMKASCGNWRGPDLHYPIISKVGGDASHGSHRVVAPVCDSVGWVTF